MAINSVDAPSDLKRRRSAIEAVIAQFETQKAFAQEIGLTESRISKALSDKYISDRRLLPIESAIDKWKDKETQEGQADDGRELPAPHALRVLSDEELAEHDLYRVRRIAVSAGVGSELVFLDERGEEEILTGDYIRKKYQIQPSRLAEVRVHGESMNGPPAHIAPGSVLRVALTDGYREILSGSVYVVYGPMGYQLKRLRIVQEQHNGHEIERYIWLWSDNEEEGRDKLPIEVWERDYQVVAMALSVESSL